MQVNDDFSAKEFDRFLSETASKPEWVYAHPFLVNGYWRFRYSPIRIIRQIGRMLNNKRIYWLGFPVYWEKGLKEILPDLPWIVLDEEKCK